MDAVVAVADSSGRVTNDVDENCYVETFETALKKEDSSSSNEKVAAPPRTTCTKQLQRKSKRNRRFSTGTGGATTAKLVGASAPVRRPITHESIQIDFFEEQRRIITAVPSTKPTEVSTPPPPCSTTSNSNDLSSTTTPTNSSTNSLRRILSTGDLPDHLNTSCNSDDEFSNSHEHQHAFCRTHSLSPFAVILGNWSSTSSSPEPPNEDASSVASSASTYFEPDDFDTGWWRQSLRDPPALGLAVVVLAAALTHPLLFAAGALTALGSVTAAHRGYRYWNSSSSNNNGDENSTDGVTKQQQQQQPSSWDSIFCFEPTATLVISSEEDQTAASATNHALLVNKHNQQDPLLKEEEKKEEEPVVQPQKTRDRTKDDSNIASFSATEKNGNACSSESSSAPPQRKKRKRLPPRERQQWSNLHYPPLKNTVVENGGQLVGLNCVEFFHVFFDNDAVYDFKEFQRKRHDIDIVYGPWTDILENNNNTSAVRNEAISMAPGESNRPTFPTDLDYRLFQGRTISFKAKTNSFLGPPYATTVKRQRILIVDKRLAILESRTNLSDIPFADRFFVMERWIVTAEKVDGRYVAHVTASCEVVFNDKGCPFEQQIRSKSVSTIQEIVKSWCTMATEALVLTEKAKLHRLQRSGFDDDDDYETADMDDGEKDVTSQPSQNNSKRNNPAAEEQEEPDSVEVVAQQWDEAERTAAGPSPHHTFRMPEPTSGRTPAPPRSSRPLASVRRSLSQLKRRNEQDTSTGGSTINNKTTSKLVQ